MAKSSTPSSDKEPAVKKAATEKKVTAKKAAPKKKAATKKKATVKKKATEKKKAASKKAATRVISAAERHRMIAEAAYLRGEAQGFHSHEVDDWLSAEAHIDSLLSKAKIEVGD